VQNAPRTASQTIPWDEGAFIGYSAEQIKLIRIGFMFGLDRCYEEEQRRIKAGNQLARAAGKHKSRRFDEPPAQHSAFGAL
jgi:hypothetical protein